MNNIKKGENVTDLVRVELLYENNGGKVYKYLKNFPPTSIEAELALFTAGHFSKQIRSSLQDESLNYVIFLP